MNGEHKVFVDVLAAAKVGSWKVEFDEGKPPRMYADDTMLHLIGIDDATGMTPEEIHHAWARYIDPSHVAALEEGTKYMIAGQHAEIQYSWHHPDGRTIIVRCGGVRDFGYTAGIRIVGIHQWVTTMQHVDFDLREQQRQLAEALDQAKSANQAKTSFLFNMSHDIRTPMNAIRGFTDIALKNIHDVEKVRSSLEKTKRAGGLLLTLINNVLDMSRIESGKARVETTAGDVMQSFSNLESTMHELALSKKVKLTFSYGDIQDRYVYADYGRCTRVFVNIISNAIKYSKPGGWVRVKCEQLKREGRLGWYRYAFADNGIGMSDEFQKHVFEEFAREHNSTTSGIQGTGLGMSLCKSIVELLGGTIKVRSVQGEGSIFIVTLPFKLQEGTEIRDPGIDSAAEDSRTRDVLPAGFFKGRRVLLVEDNELNREVAEYVLDENGFEVESVEDGSDAVRLVQEKGNEYYDFILMDIQMQIMGGYEATRLIRSEGYVRPIIALSANAFAEDREASLAAGMDAHVAKPVKTRELLSVLAKFVH